MLRVVRKLLLVPKVVAHGPGGQIGCRVNGEGQTRRGPGGDGPAGPFEDFKKIVGARIGV